MKKMITLMIVALCLCFGESQAQRRLPQQKGIQLLGGWGDGYGFNLHKNPSYYISVAFSNYTKNSHKWLYGIEFSEKKHCYRCQSIPVSLFKAEGGYYYNFLSDRGKNVFFNTGLSGIAGYETTNWGKKKLPDGAFLKNKDRFVAGAALTFEIETFVMDNLVILVNIRERFLTSDVTRWHFQTGIGIKYIYK